MNLQSKYPTTPDEFLRWNEGREGKREFVNGRVVEMMINVTRNHVVLAGRILAALLKRLDTARYDVGSADFGVKTAAGIRSPDIFVDPRGPQTKGADLATSTPVLVAEILSASSYSRDFGEKVAEYTGIASLQHYLVAAQDECRVWLWTRSGSSWHGPVQTAGPGASVDLPALGISLPLDELYANLALGPTQ